MRTECSIDMKHTILETEFHKLLLYAKKLILTYAQLRLLLTEHLKYYVIGFLTKDFLKYELLKSYKILKLKLYQSVVVRNLS